MKPSSPRKPLRDPVPGPSGSDAVHPRTDRHVVGDAAGAGAAPAADTGSGNSGSSADDWLGEMHLKGSADAPAADPAPQGVPVSTRSRGDARRGQAIESKRERR